MAEAQDAGQPPSQTMPPEQGGSGGKKVRSDEQCVFVGNLAFTTTWQRLKDVMRKAGDVQLVELIVDGSHKPKGSALVTFGSEDDAKKAVTLLNSTVVDGRELLVRPYAKGARPLVIYGNYTREQLNRVAPKVAGAGQMQGGRPAPNGGRGGFQPPAPNGGRGGIPAPNPVRGGFHPPAPLPVRGGFHGSAARGGFHQQHSQPGTGDGGDFNKRNRDTFGDDAMGYRPHGNGVPAMPAPASAGAGQDTKKLFVSNLPFTCTWKLLKDTFNQVGRVVRADVIMDDRGRSRGMGTVVYGTTEDAKKAIEEFDGIEMDGRPMGVRFDRDQ